MTEWLLVGPPQGGTAAFRSFLRERSGLLLDSLAVLLAAVVGLAMGLRPLAVAFSAIWLGVAIGVSLWAPSDHHRVSEGRRTLLAVLVTMVVTLLSVSVASVELSRAVTWAVLPLTICLAMVGRLIMGFARPEAGLAQRVLLVGSTADVAEIMTTAAGTDAQMVITSSSAWDIEAVVQLVAQTSPDSVLVVDRTVQLEDLRALAWALRGSRTAIALPVLWDVDPDRVCVRRRGGVTTVEVHPMRAGDREWAQRVVDKGLALMALVLLAPLMLAIALAIRVESPGPVLFRHERTGFAGRRFHVLKFRTMVVGADDMKPGLAQGNQYSSGTLFKMKEDPRVTRLGKVLRTWSLDELPQLFNVLRGDMALVGPRPTSALPEDMREDYRKRTLVKPGLTGLWQVSGRSKLDFEDAVKLDLHYVENRSPAMDARIIRKTVRAVLKREGAY